MSEGKCPLPNLTMQTQNFGLVNKLQLSLKWRAFRQWASSRHQGKKMTWTRQRTARSKRWKGESLTRLIFTRCSSVLSLWMVGIRTGGFWLEEEQQQQILAQEVLGNRNAPFEWTEYTTEASDLQVTISINKARRDLWWYEAQDKISWVKNNPNNVAVAETAYEDASDDPLTKAVQFAIGPVRKVGQLFVSYTITLQMELRTSTAWKGCATQTTIKLVFMCVLCSPLLCSCQSSLSFIGWLIWCRIVQKLSCRSHGFWWATDPTFVAWCCHRSWILEQSSCWSCPFHAFEYQNGAALQWYPFTFWCGNQPAGYPIEYQVL